MNAKDRIMAALRHKEPDVVPFAVKDLQYLYAYGVSEAHRKLMEMGLGIYIHLVARAHRNTTPHVKMEVSHDYGNESSWCVVDSWAPSMKLGILRKVPYLIHTTLKTPKGNVSTTATYQEPCPWITEGGYMIKDSNDYELVKFIVEDTEYHPNYEDILGVQSVLENDGVVSAFTPKSPLQEMLAMMGIRRFSLDYHMHRKEFDELYRVIYRKVLEAFEIVAESPAEIAFQCDDLSGDITSPELFEKYCISFYNEAAGILHRNGKIYSVHMCGRLASLRDLIPKTAIDVIDGFTPPPMGNLPLRDAREAWKGKVIWANFPESVSLQGQDAVEKTTIDMLKSAAPGDDFLLQMGEDFPSPAHALESVTTILKTVMKYGVYPIRLE